MDCHVKNGYTYESIDLAAQFWPPVWCVSSFPGPSGRGIKRSGSPGAILRLELFVEARC